jgi:hypothetical protein
LHDAPPNDRIDQEDFAPDLETGRSPYWRFWGQTMAKLEQASREPAEFVQRQSRLSRQHGHAD